ncbi:MAG: hypothetical protein AMS23_09580 [Bacteroides sp. SM1_62]|nr:MAG: hypothetical protein AMS23_09580 [Bacteroides sp. SM1_62]
MIFAFSTLLYADVPQMMNYQGKLTTPAGALIDSTLSMVISIYDNQADVSPVWAETLMVQVEKGIFSVVLGNVHPLTNDLFDGTVQYLGVKAGTDPEMTPRKEIVSVGYAYRAAYAEVAVNDGDWNFRITDTADTTLMTGGEWGIARSGNVLYGNTDSTHVNLGVACTTGTSGQNYNYCTVAGGYLNTASGENATIGGGYGNTANDINATVGGGYSNTASGDYSTVAGGYGNQASSYSATIGGGFFNTASRDYSTIAGGYNSDASGISATVGGGYRNTASGDYSTVPGGYADTAGGDFSLAAGDGVRITGDGDYTFAFGRNFTTATPNAVIFHNSVDPIKIGVGTTVPDEELHVVGNIKMVDGNQAAGKVLTSDASGVGTWQAAAGGIGGSGTANYVSKFTASTTLGNSIIYEESGNVGIGTSNPSNPIWVNGTVLEIVEPTTNDAAAVVLRNLNSEKNNSNGGVIFGNQEEPNICRIVGAADDSLNSGKIYFGTRNAGTYSTKMMIRANGNVGIGTMSPQGALDVSSTTGAFIVPRMTTAQRDALSAVNGMIIYNTTTNQFNFYENGAWVTK